MMSAKEADDWMSQIKADHESPDALNWDALHPDLKPYVIEGALGKMVKAPLVVEIAPCIPTVNRVYVEKKAFFDRAVAARKWSNALVYVERAWRLSLLAEWFYTAQMTHAQLREHMAWVWSDAEPDDTNPEWLRLWRFAVSGKRIEEPPDKHLPKGKLTLYRGQHALDEERGIAWSTNIEIAKMFATRWNKGEFGFILRGTAKRGDVLAFIEERGESEVVIDPKAVTVTSYQPIPTIGDTDAQRGTFVQVYKDIHTEKPR